MFKNNGPRLVLDVGELRKQLVETGTHVRIGCEMSEGESTKQGGSGGWEGKGER